MNVKIESSWKEALKDEFDQPYFYELTNKVRELYLGEAPVYPQPQYIFNAFTLCPFDKVRVVIVGQDPYHGPGQAHGLCFSVQDGIAPPPSLLNIFKELHSDLESPIKKTGNLESWATQGVLLLNAVLTVTAHKAGSHQNIGWEQFTDAVIKKISDERKNIVFILWGKYAERKGEIIDAKKHYSIRSAHPSPLSAHNGFFGSKPFSKTNTYLKEHNIPPIHW